MHSKIHHQNLPLFTLCLCVSLYWIQEDLLLLLWFIHSEVNIYMNHLCLSVTRLSMPCCQNLVSSKLFCMGQSLLLQTILYCQNLVISKWFCMGQSSFLQTTFYCYINVTDAKFQWTNFHITDFAWPFSSGLGCNWILEFPWKCTSCITWKEGTFPSENKVEKVIPSGSYQPASLLGR